MATTSVVEAQVEIDRSITDVFRATTDVPRWSQWQVRFVEVEKVSPGEFALGTKIRTVSEALGKRFEMQSEVTEFLLNEAITFSGSSETLTYSSKWSFESLGDKTTRVSVRMESRANPKAVLAKLVHPWLSRVFRKRLEADLESFKVMLDFER
jgi:uncharacterized membrane protein